VAVTIDDLPTASVLGNDLELAQPTTTTLLAALTRNGVPAIGFVNEAKLRSDAGVDPRRVALLRQWLDAGFDLGNHTFSHMDLHSTPLEVYERQVLDGEKITRQLLRERGKRIRYFRHPFLHAGRSAPDRHRFEAFLTQHGYIVAPITIDNYDYVFAAAYDRAGARHDAKAQATIGNAYISYMDAVAAYYEQQSVAIVGREVRQTLLIHASALNAVTFDRLASMFRARGYRFISLDRALEDPAYRHRDEYYGPAGMTWLHRWAITDGKRGAIFAGEPLVPEWIEQGSR
ncbi:MAG: polysaccharide deacetylase family protein, partial [Vicinamibacterales bacterium]